MFTKLFKMIVVLIKISRDSLARDGDRIERQL